ncbi:unnamed protein product [Pseudo-nitzschia multistriata]|uniref:Uncharacterized protein n=1 Tax=Pseudo-nitzschia multistriata TaxID=183589 RepID=A0A448ZQR8_9STRA|nr:unnamed protein product [Pseudo-nitzschia multistriata]
MRVFHRSLGPHADRPSGTWRLDNGMVGLGSSLAVKVKYLTNGIGSLQNFNLGLRCSLAGVLRPPHDLNTLN